MGEVGWWGDGVEVGYRPLSVLPKHERHEVFTSWGVRCEKKVKGAFFFR